MNGHPGHPAAEELAELRAGVTDEARAERLESHLSGCPDCVSASERLAEIPALLASLPSPALPPAVETMITGALAAETVRRDSAAGCAAASPLPVSSAAAPASSVLPRIMPASPATHVSLAGGSRRPPAAVALGVVGAVAACLLLVFIGLRLTGTPSAPSPPGGTHARPGVPPITAPGMHPANLGPGQTPAAPFPVFVSTTDFRQSTLRAQILRQFPVAVSPGPSGHPGARIRPSPALVGCVAQITGHVTPSAVEEATYQSRPVYVIAVPGYAWVVARDCTPTAPSVLASVALPLSP